MAELLLWQRILLYAFILIALFIFVKTSQLKINGRNIIKLKYRIALALFFPLIFVILFIFSSILITIVLIAIFIVFLASFFIRRRYRL